MSTNTTGFDPNEWMSTEEAAKVLDCSTSTVRRRIEKGVLDYAKSHGHFLVRRDQVDAAAARPPLHDHAEASAGRADLWLVTATEQIRQRLGLPDGTEVPPMLKLPQVARALGVDVRQLRRSAEAGSIRAVKIGSRYQVARATVIEILTGGAAA